MAESMTPRMVRALADAEAAVHDRGLERTRAGWRCTHPAASLLDYHGSQTIGALVRRGWLDLWNAGLVAHITDAGAAALERCRERRAREGGA